MKITTLFHTIIAGLIFLLALLTLEVVPDYGGGYSEHGFASHRDINRPVVPPSHTSGAIAGKAKVSETGFAGSKKEAEKEYRSAAFHYFLGSAVLSGEEGSMGRETNLTIGGLLGEEVPALNTGMVNVTGEHNAYRMLPHGMVFEKDIDIVLPYDTALLPPGFSPYDIMTYYYDEQYGRWIVIERDSVDKAGCCIYSKVNHFTDFINAVIRTPEMPETQGYVPTQMSDIKVADPLEGIPVIVPPTANNQGTANVQYPIKIPAGRQGMQPNLVLAYSSDEKKNGWLGTGWGIPVPEITVETRWGVPRYDKTMESEVYLLNGEPLVTKNDQDQYNPLVHRGEWKERKRGEVRFYPVKEGTFQKIIRHGDHPKNYWWEVRDKNGLVYYYGKKPVRDEVDRNSVLHDADTNIAKWGLTEVRDLNGNFIRYHYQVVSRGIGKAMYIKEITYTGHNLSEGKYSLRFERKQRADLGFRDVTTNARYGFMAVSDDLLSKVVVCYGNEELMEYRFSYYSPAGKTLLKKIEEHYPYYEMEEAVLPEEEVNTVYQEFDYYTSDISFGKEVTLETMDDIQTLRFVNHPYIEVVKPFGHEDMVGHFDDRIESHSLAPIQSEYAIGHEHYNYFGRHFKKRRKEFSTSFPNGLSRNEQTQLFALIDIDGDGLPDKLIRKKYGNNTGLFYRRQYLDNGKYKFSPLHELQTYSGDYYWRGNIAYSEGYSDYKGTQFVVEKPGKAHMKSISFHTSLATTSVYLTDVDGDGLPDMVDNGTVYYNRETRLSGRRRFVKLNYLYHPCYPSGISDDKGLNPGIFEE